MPLSLREQRTRMNMTQQQVADEVAFVFGIKHSIHRKTVAQAETQPDAVAFGTMLRIATVVHGSRTHAIEALDAAAQRILHKPWTVG